ncbi:uncharacterized protein JCM6883_003422 [Sporobolomyces salmoneus]|uniref:uncharacterized protein n=1 Tax=Sporobolomyces salmoneus TaxID=183962 RepID=UPI0031823359
MAALFPPAKDGAVPVLVLDGGMGTTLQSYPVAQQLDSNLWSSELLKTREGRETLRDLHSKWIEAGADIVQTCTYQSSLPLFLPSSGPYSQELLDSSLILMNSAIPLLTELPLPSSCSHSHSHSDSMSKKPLNSLSLGPFGASLQPGQEYAGLYPPPFGPTPSISPSRFASGQEAFDSIPLPLEIFHTSSSDEASPEDYLSAWHLLRLRNFSKSPQFKDLSVLSFETVPNLYEARAIRRAMTQFRRETGSTIPFYISFVFPLVGTDTSEERVKLPDQEYKHLESLEEQAPFVIQATFGQPKDVDTPLVPADAIGFNCTSPLHCKSVTSILTSSYRSFISSQPSTTFSSSAPFFVLYPDGGAVYSVETRTWSHPLGLTDEKWANLVADAMEIAREGGVWGGVVGGGCCKSGVGAIGALRREVERRGWR